jgi:hypothetical protein
MSSGEGPVSAANGIAASASAAHRRLDAGCSITNRSEATA